VAKNLTAAYGIYESDTNHCATDRSARRDRWRSSINIHIVGPIRCLYFVWGY
jgi:hypothetical protein